MPANVESMMYVGKQPWHGLGVYVGDKNLTSREAITCAGLNWNVEKRRSCFQLKDGQFRKGEGFDLVRTDQEKSLGHVGDVYTPLQNEEAFEFMDALVGAGRAVYHTAGSLGDGRKIWILVDMKEEAEIVNGDPVGNFVLLSNGHDGRTTLDIGLTSVRVVCRNTLNLALSRREKGRFFSFRHTRGIQGKNVPVKEALLSVSEKFSKFIEEGKKLASRQVTRKELDDFLIRLELERADEREAVSPRKVSEFKRSEKYRELVRAFEISPGNNRPGVSGTLWAALNAVTYYVDHTAPSRKTDHFATTREARLNSAWFNGGVAKKNRAFELALEMAGKL